jgi:hypothetical protein
MSITQDQESRRLPVELVLTRYGRNEPPERFATLREALLAIDSAVEFDAAGPERLTMPTTIIGAEPVTFDSMQLYAMLELVQEGLL